MSGVTIFSGLSLKSHLRDLGYHVGIQSIFGDDRVGVMRIHGIDKQTVLAPIKAWFKTTHPELAVSFQKSKHLLTIWAVDKKEFDLTLTVVQDAVDYPALMSQI